MEPAARRRRMEIGYTPVPGNSQRRKKAIAIAAKIKAKYPYNEWGTSYTKRGSDLSLRVYGPSYRQANQAQRQNRKDFGYIGRGLYSAQDLSRDVKTLAGKKLSRALTNQALRLVNPFTTDLYRGSGLYSGRGLYTNNLIDKGTGSIPMVAGSGDETGAITISHTEYICDIFGPTANFENLPFSLNPGLESTFPWLSQVAQNFEEYEFNQLLFHYTSTITDIGSSTSGQCGTLTMATDYNAAHKPFSDKAEMLGYAHSYSCKTTESMDHGVECDPSKNAGTRANYIRSTPIASTEDIKTYDHGIFQLAVTNCPAGLQNQSLGELRVTYSITLRKPKLYTARGLGISRDFFVTPSSAATGAISTGAQLISASQLVYSGVNNNIGTRIVGTAGGFQIYFPDYFTGHVRITVLVKLLQNAGGANFLLNAPTFTGNILPIKELYGQDGQPTAQFISSTIATGGGINEDSCVITHLFIRASTGGVDNVVLFPSVTGSTSLVQTFVNIEEYNSYDKTDSASVNNVVNPTTGIVIAGNAI